MVSSYADRLNGLGLATPSLQAIYFGLEGASLLAEESAFEPIIERTKLVAELGALIQARTAVFGAPKLRQRNGLSKDAAVEISASRLDQLTEICARNGIVLAMEPVPEAYGGDFLAQWRDLANVVNLIRNAYFRLHLDIGCVHLGGDDIIEAIREGREILAHYHISEPNLDGFEACILDHAAAGAALRSVCWSNWVAIEMRERSNNPIAAIETAIETARRAYLQESAATMSPERKSRTE
jgi:sugar phosphate isomerase/epimerase